MNNYNAKNVINGTFGEVWVAGKYMAQATALEAKVDFNYEDVKMTKKLATSKKLSGYSGSGSVKLNHVSSYFIELLSDQMKNGKMVVCTIISNLEDPDALGGERVQLNNVVFDDLTLANWENGSIGEEDVSFTFEDWKVIDKISDK